MEPYRRGDKNDVEETKASGRGSREKPALSPIEEEEEEEEEEETDSLDSSGDSVINFRGIDHTDSSKKWRYDLRVSLFRDYEEIVRDLEEEEIEEEKQPTESPPFLTARNGSEHEAGSKSGDSSATSSYERSTPEDEPDDSSAPGESTSVDAVYYYDGEEQDEEEEEGEEEEEEEEEGSNTHDLEVESFTEMTRNVKNGSGPKSAPAASVFVDSSATNRDDRIGEISTTVDRLRIRIVKSEGEIYRLKKQLRNERLRSYKLAKRYDEDASLTKESLRLDLEMWIKKLNDGLKRYLAEWQRRERLRINEEVSRISDLYSQEIAKSFKTSLRDWQTEESRKMLEAFETRDKSREDRARSNTKGVYEKIQIHLENLEKQNRKSWTSFRKQIDKWEARLRDQVVRLREENLIKLWEKVDKWSHVSHPESANVSPPPCENADEKQSFSLPGADALIQVEESLLKRLRESSSKDLRRMEQIVRTELKAQRRELARRINDKISELWMSYEELGCVGLDRSGSRRLTTSGLPAPPVRNDLEGASLGKDSILDPDVLRGRSVAGKIVRAIRTGGSTRSNTEVEDGDRDYCEDDDDDTLPEDVWKREISDRSTPSPS